MSGNWQPGQEETPREEQAPFRMARVGRHTLVYGLGILLGKLVSFVMLPVYTRFLTPADYGVMQLIEMTLDVIAIMAGARVAIGIFRYYYKAQTETERNGVVSTALMVLAMSYGSVGFMVFLASELLSNLVFGGPEHAGLIRLASGSLAASSLSVAPLAYLRARERSTLFLMSNLGRLVLQVTLNVVLLTHYGLGIRAVFLSSLITNLVIGAALAIYLVNQVGVRFSRSATRDLLRYGIPLIATELATFLATFGDRYFINAAADTTAVGLYTLAYQFGFLAAAVGYLPFEMVWEPMRFSIAHREDRDELFARAFIYLNIMLITVAMGISLFSTDVLRLLTTPAFYPAARYVPIIVVAYVFQGWVGMQDVGIHMRERTEFIALANWLAAAVAVLGYWLFIPRYLGMGAAVVTVVAFFVRYYGCYWISQKLWPVRYRWVPIWKLAALAVVAVAAGRSLRIEELWLSIAVKSGIVLIYGLAVWNLGVVPSEERTRIREAVLAALAILGIRNSGRRASSR